MTTFVSSISPIKHFLITILLSVYAIASEDSKQYYLDLQISPVSLDIYQETTALNALESIFNKFNPSIAVDISFEPKSLGDRTIDPSLLNAQPVKNHLLLICSTIGAKFEMNGYPPKLKIIQVNSPTHHDTPTGIEKWKENIHQRQMLLHPEKFNQSEVIPFAKEQIRKSDLFRISKNNQGVVPNEILAINILIGLPNSQDQIKELYYSCSNSGKLYCLVALRAYGKPNLDLENQLRKSRSYVGFQDPELDLIGAKQVSWILETYVLNTDYILKNMILPQ